MVNPFDIVIFGGSSFLAERRLMPALYRAFCEQKLAADCRIVISCRTMENADIYQQRLTEAMPGYLAEAEFNDASWQQFSALIVVQVLDITLMDERWQQLSRLIKTTTDRARVFYLAIPSSIFGVCCQHMAEVDLLHDNSRVVVEEPIGFDAVSAQSINDQMTCHIAESCIYRLDHYMGKETVQNLMALRFSNFIFEELWDANSIDHVQISISESVGLDGREVFYNKAGALRDMVQNHLLQLLCLVAMESPHKLNAKKIHAEKIKILQALRPMSAADVEQHTVRGQYVAGSYRGELVHGYLEELGLPTSNTETFVAMRVFIDNWRWGNVPFYLRTGKRMKQRCAEIVIQFKQVSHRVYLKGAGNMQPNRLVIRLQPEEQIQLTLMAKNMQVLDIQLRPAVLNLNFSDTYDQFKSDAYKRLILDAAAANPSLFIQREEVAQAWSWIDPIIAAWQTSKPSPHLYRAGSWGPDESDQLLAKDGRRWFNSGEPVE
jgi:glucose-6-phosphate 1-dehydrogenase